MVLTVMTSRIVVPRNLFLATLACCAFLALAPSAFAGKDKKPDQIEKPMAGPRATALRVTWLYVSPDTGSQKVDRVQVGRELVVAEKSGSWIRVFANTDIYVDKSQDAPIIGSNDVPPPVSGWMEARGIVVESTPNADQILMGEAANEEALASDPRGPALAAQSARSLYRRLVEIFPNSPLAPEAAWRAADILWQLQKADASSRPSAKEKDPILRDQMDEDEMKKVIKLYPHTRPAALAAYALIDNKLCGDWQGSAKCPAHESELYERYADEYSDSPRAAQALYQAVYRQAVLRDMFAGEGSDKKSEAAHDHARELATHLKEKYPQSDYAARAAALVFKLDQGVPVYGIDRP